ncbi:MAG: sugar ABC transporter permease [Planctomycetes bacterium]|nr:sugar ABC transporter permease [Planctomycetota bacterium]
MKARAWLFVTPWIVGLCVFTLYPFAASLYYSFTDYSVLKPATPAGLANYTELAGDPIFRRALGNTVMYSLLALVPGILVALGLAKALNTKVTGTSFYRSAIYIPHLVPTVASSILWMWMLNADTGLLNALLRPVLDVIGWRAPSFLQDERFLGLDFQNKEVIFGALPSLALMSLWGCGQMAIIYLAKLQDVPQDLYEAAELDGAGAWAVFWNIELPQLSPMILFNIVMGIIGTFQIFAEPYILTGGTGGPNYATYLVPMFIYQHAFEYQRMGYACAAAWILFGLIALLTLVAFRIGQRRVYYAGE